VREACCRALARWSRIARYEDPVAWVRRVAWNLAISRWRRARTALTALARLHRSREDRIDGPGPDRVALITALATLPKPQRRAVVLHYLADLPVSEIADQLQVPVGTVKSWLYRARTALAAQLAHTRRLSPANPRRPEAEQTRRPGPAPYRTHSGDSDDRTYR